MICIVHLVGTLVHGFGRFDVRVEYGGGLCISNHFVCSQVAFVVCVCNRACGY